MTAFDCPVLLIVFNRPEKADKVFNRIREIKPRQLFVAADAPRQGNEEDQRKCEMTRRVATAVDWDCEVRTLFQEVNQGCGKGPAAAISWFFSQVDSGIILEDDCLPEKTFFRFCNELLLRYRDNQQVMMISGTTPVRVRAKKADYFFSKYGTTWGWASWKRAWMKFDYDLKCWSHSEERDRVMASFRTAQEKQYFEDIFERTFNKTDVSWWDYQWLFARLLCGGVSIMPVSNQVENIGFGKDATHTFDSLSPDANKKTEPLQFPLRHPEVIRNDEAYDSGLLFRKRSLFERIEYRIKKLLSE